jgi:hypothetical protein
MICREDTTVKSVLAPPKVTTLLVVKSLPTTTTWVPPLLDPTLGVIELIAGASRYSSAESE